MTRRRPAAREWDLQDRLRDLNLRILKWADDPHAPADLVCECVDPQCFSVVSITPAAFGELESRGEYVVSLGHTAGRTSGLPAVA